MRTPKYGRAFASNRKPNIPASAYTKSSRGFWRKRTRCDSVRMILFVGNVIGKSISTIWLAEWPTKSKRTSPVRCTSPNKSIWARSRSSTWRWRTAMHTHARRNLMSKWKRDAYHSNCSWTFLFCFGLGYKKHSIWRMTSTRCQAMRWVKKATHRLILNQWKRSKIISWLILNKKVQMPNRVHKLAVDSTAAKIVTFHLIRKRSLR